MIILLAGLVALAAVFFGAKLVMPHKAPSNPIAAVTSAPDKARAAAAASKAASAKLSTATGSAGATTTTVTRGTGTTTSPAGSTGPEPNTIRNPFVP